MWLVVKFDKKKLEFLKKDFKRKFNEELNFYIPKILVQKYQKNTLVNKEHNLLDDYLFCYLNGFNQSQEDIKKFIGECKKLENKKGYLSQNIFDLKINSNYKFSSGPFCEMIFKIIDLQKDRINILMGNLKTTIKKKEFLFNPV